MPTSSSASNGLYDTNSYVTIVQNITVAINEITVSITEINDGFGISS